MRLYYFLGNLLRPFSIVGLNVYSYITRRPRVRLIVQNEKKEVLLVQSWLGGKSWGLPGGGVERGEDSMNAAVRELREETTIAARIEALIPICNLPHARHEEIVFSLTVPASSLPEQITPGFEIKDAQWFSMSELPHLEPLARKVIDQVTNSR